MLSQILDDIRHKNILCFESKAIDELKAFECWVPLLENFKKILNEHPTQELYKELLLICLFYYPDIEMALNYSKIFLETSALSFDDFDEQILRDIPLSDDDKSKFLFALEEKIPGSIKQSYWIYMCRFCEKKIHNYEKLSEFQKKILKEDPKNLNALVYFKNISIQKGLEEKTLSYLLAIIQSLQDKPYKRQKFSYELSNFYFYQMNEPERAIWALEAHSIDLQLPHYQLLYEAAFALKNWTQCESYLNKILSFLTQDQSYQRSLVFYEKGLIADKMGYSQEAIELFQKAHDEAPQFFSPIEALVDLSIKNNDHVFLQKTLDRLLRSLPQEEPRREQILQIKKRLTSQMEKNLQ